MKTKQIIYVLFMIIGALIMSFGPTYVEKEYALAIGIIFLMFGIYKTSNLYTSSNQENKEIEDEF